MPDDLHVVAQPEIHEGIRGCEIVAILAFTRMDALSLVIVLRGDWVELLLEQGHMLRVLLRAPAKRPAARNHAAVDRRAHSKMILGDVLQRSGLVRGLNARADGEHRHSQPHVACDCFHRGSIGARA